MYLLRSVLPSLLVLFSLHVAHGIILPVSEDTSALTKGKLTAKAGKATTLSVAPGRAALVRFDAGTAAASIPTEEIARARLVLYLPKVTKQGELTLHTVSTEWSEAVATSTPQPAFAPIPLATIPAEAVVAKQFVIVDVTAQVKEWITHPSSDFGFAIASSGVANVLLGAKEGPGSGYPAILEIESLTRVTDSLITPGVDATKLGTGSVNNTEFGYLDGVTASLQIQLDGLGTGVASLNSAVATSLQPQLDNLSGKITDLNTALGEKVSKAGDTMSGALNLPSDGLAVGTNQLMARDGRVGVGTATPAATLDVRGNVKLGAQGEFFAPASEENLRIVRGTVQYSGGANIVSGGGFRISSSSAFSFSIVFDPPFASMPTITATQETPTSYSTVFMNSVTSTGATIFGIDQGKSVHIIAIGPR